MFMADQDALACPSHSMLLVMFFQSLQAGNDRWVFFWLGIFGAKCVVRERVEADSLRLVRGEGFGEYGTTDTTLAMCFSHCQACIH